MKKVQKRPNIDIRHVLIGMAIVAIAAVGVARTLPAHADSRLGVGIRVTPASQQGWLTATLARGSSTQFHFIVNNPGTATSFVTMFSSGAGGVYSPSRPGGNYLAVQPTDAFNSWNHFSPTTFTLQPGQSQDVTDTITVPSNAPLGLQPGANGVPTSLKYNVAWAFASPAVPPTGQVTNLVSSGVREYVTIK